MKKEYRLKKNEEIQQLIQKKRSIVSRSFVVYYYPNSTQHIRVCVSVGKKIGNSVIRNKIKRQIKSMVRDTFELNKGYDYLIVVRKDYLNQTFIQNKNELQRMQNNILFKKGEQHESTVKKNI